MFTLLFSLFVRTGVTWESHNTIMWLSQQNFSKFSKFHERAILVLGGQLSSLSRCELDQSGSAMGGNFAHRQKLKMIEESLCE